MDDIISDEDVRRERDHARLRTNTPVCLTCGYDRHTAAMEYSHIAPRQFHDDGGVQCCKCHREFSDAEKGLPYKPETQNPMMETIARYLLALAEWFKRIAGTLEVHGQWLMVQAEHILPYEREA